MKRFFLDREDQKLINDCIKLLISYSKNTKKKKKVVQVKCKLVSLNKVGQC